MLPASKIRADLSADAVQVIGVGRVRSGAVVPPVCRGHRFVSDAGGHDDRESFALRGLRELPVERHQPKRRGLILSGRERRPELQRVRCSQGVDPEEPYGVPTKPRHRLDLLPGLDNASSRSSASTNDRPSRLPSRSRRAMADTHSTSVAHHTIRSGSCS